MNSRGSLTLGLEFTDEPPAFFRQSDARLGGCHAYKGLRKRMCRLRQINQCKLWSCDLLSAWRAPGQARELDRQMQVVADAHGLDKDSFYRQMLGNSRLVVAFGALLAWLVLILPGCYERASVVMSLSWESGAW